MYTYSSENGWGTLASSLDDAHKDLFAQLKALDFTQTRPELLLCRSGSVHLYTRYVPPGKKTLPLAFDFCCLLTIGGLLYVVGLKTLQDVFAFLKEIDAHPVVPQPMTLTESERKAVQEYISTLTDQMEQRTAPLVHVAIAWQKTVERLAKALEAMSQPSVAGQPGSTSPVQVQATSPSQLGTSTVPSITESDSFRVTSQQQ